MKYKLLNHNGMHLICLEDNTRIPCQVSATSQTQREKCVVRVDALLDERLGARTDPKLNFSDGVLTYGKYVLDDISDVVTTAGTSEPEWVNGTISFTVVCDLPDTVPQPKPYEA
jgi:hypothetical protein